MPDVIKFGKHYVAQSGEAAELLAMVSADWAARCAKRQRRAAAPSLSDRGRTAYMTRALRVLGLTVVTTSSVRFGPRYGRASETRRTG